MNYRWNDWLNSSDMTTGAHISAVVSRHPITHEWEGVVHYDADTSVLSTWQTREDAKEWCVWTITNHLRKHSKPAAVKNDVRIEVATRD